MSKALIIKFQKGLKGYRDLLEASRDSLARIDWRDKEIEQQRSALITQFAVIEDEIRQFSQHPQVADPVWRQYQDAYHLAISNDILQRVGPAIDAALDDLQYVIAKHDLPETKKISSKDQREPYIDVERQHPKIVQYCSKKFKDGHLSDAVLTAYKVVLNEIKEISGIRDKDGKQLVEHVLSLNNPIIKLNDLLTQSEKDEQQGFMLLYSGAALGIRNPKAHDLLEQDDPLRALQLLSFATLLMNRLDERKEPIR